MNVEHAVGIAIEKLRGEDAHETRQDDQLDAMARYVVERLDGALGSLRGATVLILGLAYRPNVKEAANSRPLAYSLILAILSPFTT